MGESYFATGTEKVENKDKSQNTINFRNKEYKEQFKDLILVLFLYGK